MLANERAENFQAFKAFPLHFNKLFAFLRLPRVCR